MKKYISIAILVSFYLPLISQITSVTLEECQEKARINYPLIRQYDLIALSEQYSLSNIARSYLPQFVLNGQATYQSDVTKIPIDLSGLPLPNPIEIPTIDKDQYKVTLDVSQLIWDGGAVRSRNKITKANTEVEKNKVEVSLYDIKDKINQLYFGILALNEQLELLRYHRENMQSNHKVAESMFKYGTAMQSDLDLIEVELLNIDQNETELIATREAYLKMLSLFIHEELSDSVILRKPDTAPDYYKVINRPELSLYAAQRSLLDSQTSSINAKNMPKFSLFAQGGYGRPGLNMFKTDFDFYAIGGIKLTWNFGNLYTRNNERKLIDINKNIVDSEEETFLFNTNIRLKEKDSEIRKFRELMNKDNEIISLRTRVKQASESKYKNGVYQINELIGDINAENLARQNKSLHEIQYLLSIYNYKHIQGN